MTLFVPRDFIGHAGQRLFGKIECDTLTTDDWIGIVLLCQSCGLIPDKLSDVDGVPRGGYPFADAILRYARFIRSGTAPRLVVDDVLTTGGSIIAAMDRPDDIGLVVFARGSLPPRVTALFTMAPQATAPIPEALIRYGLPT